MADKIKIGVIGCRVGRTWVAGAKAGEDTTAWAVADLNQELAQQVAADNDVPRVYGDYRELLADDEVEAVGIATAPDVRKPMVIDALNAGKHVLAQKPHGRNAADVEEINNVAASIGKTLVYSYFMRHEVENKKTRQIIAAGKIGQVDRHSEDYLSFLVGCANGITIQMDTSAVIPTWSDRAWDLRLRILGTAGTIEQESTSQPSGTKRSGTRRLLGAIYTEGDDFIDEYVAHSDGDFNGEIRDFADAIRGTNPPDVSPTDALTFMKLLDAIYLSAETGEKVQIS
ncbi:Trans-1,2-dihydrobenzene-1,2-diol dehydrogenase [Geodia barretti]|uniref:Trans-1,2-dihydrobenzene-1,2-diol dehydrogenase n=1 Tax=Geodia barretti TaxID=519541 RepID=A0AA35S9J3_GEOBA|nr:Trans-1,2-dihydrobenzene-1,2-diol dehydrogenase [Geodia barretti]